MANRRQADVYALKAGMLALTTPTSDRLSEAVRRPAEAVGVGWEAGLADLIVAVRGGVPIRLGQIATVEDGLEDARSLARLNGQRAVSLLVRRQSGKNLLDVATSVKERLDELRGRLPKGYTLIVAEDLSVFVDENISEAQGELIRGATLAVLVILLFLRMPETEGTVKVEAQLDAETPVRAPSRS